MPTDMSKYPANWPEIRNRILRRAGGSEDDPRIGARCERCGLVNYDYGYRLDDGMFVTYADENIPSYEEAKIKAHSLQRGKHEKIIVIVLTIAHINDPDPMNCSPDNLQALCQKCHNRHDVPHRKQNRAMTRRGRKIEAGQLLLLA